MTRCQNGAYETFTRRRVAGWVTGFLIAIAWGATRANNARLASTLSVWAIVGMVVIALLLLSIAATDLVERRRSARALDPKTTPVATDTTDIERRAAVRIAELAELEPMLRKEVVDAVAKLVGAAATGPTPDLARELEALRGKTR